LNREGFDEVVPAVFRKAAFESRRLIGLGWFRPDEEDDIKQDLLLHWWRKRRVIPTGAGIESAYGAAVVRNKAQDLVRRDYTPIRDRRKNDPLPEELPGDDGEPALPRTLVTEPRYDSAIDVRRVIEQLPLPKQQFAWLLADQGLVAAAEAAGISRSTASRWKVEIRERLSVYGLDHERPTGGRRA
jgi:DNA-directed RNA polymerase specialized sigma24 family protein